MADIIRLPARPNLDQYRKLAKDFQRACESGTPNAVRDWAAAWLTRADLGEPGDVGRIERTWSGLLKTRPALLWKPSSELSPPTNSIVRFSTLIPCKTPARILVLKSSACEGPETNGS